MGIPEDGSMVYDKNNQANRVVQPVQAPILDVPDEEIINETLAGGSSTPVYLFLNDVPFVAMNITITGTISFVIGATTQDKADPADNNYQDATTEIAGGAVSASKVFSSGKLAYKVLELIATGTGTIVVSSNRRGE